MWRPRAMLLAFLGIILAGPRAVAQPMNLTVYHDGESCPGHCDAHVVFHPRHNGTAAASMPGSSRAAPLRCVAGQPCRICFGSDDATCMLALYRGNGPALNRFDVTPAFLDAHCGQSGVPAVVADKCRGLDRLVQRYAGRTYCLAQPEDPRCEQVLAAARTRYEADRPLYERCLQLGEARFNATQPPERQRQHRCAYERLSTGQNSKGETWSRLLPGACPPPTRVGANGLDCCTESLRNSLAFGESECRRFVLPLSR
jgi:hypothetical protein